MTRSGFSGSRSIRVQHVKGKPAARAAPRAGCGSSPRTPTRRSSTLSSQPLPVSQRTPNTTTRFPLALLWSHSSSRSASPASRTTRQDRVGGRNGPSSGRGSGRALSHTSKYSRSCSSCARHVAGVPAALSVSTTARNCLRLAVWDVPDQFSASEYAHCSGVFACGFDSKLGHDECAVESENSAECVLVVVDPGGLDVSSAARESRPREPIRRRE